MVVALELEAVGDELQLRAAAELPAEAAEQRPAVAVLDFALRAIDADWTTLAVQENSAPLQRRPGGRVENAAAPSNQARGLAAKRVAVESVLGGGLVERADRPAITGRRADRDLVDHAAGRADALERVRPVDDLDAIDEEGIDRIAVARAVANGRRLGDSIDREQCRSATKAFARSGQLLARRGESRHPRRDRVDHRPGYRHGLVQVRSAEDIEGQGQGRCRKHAPRAGDHNFRGLSRLPLGGGGRNLLARPAVSSRGFRRHHWRIRNNRRNGAHQHELHSTPLNWHACRRA